jgi:hypothetical protein
MARLVLENMGVSLAIASLWFFGMPVWVQWGRGGGVVVRIRPNLTLGAVILFGVSMWITFTLQPSEPLALLAWHGVSMIACGLGFWAISTWAPQTFAPELWEVLRRPASIPLLAAFLAFVSHGFRMMALFPFYMSS